MSEEDVIQAGIVKYLRLVLQPPARVFAVPNGGVRNIITARRLKRTGAVAGVPDLIIMAPDLICFAEVKTAKGRLQPTQIDFRNDALACGHSHAILRSLDDAQNLVKALRLQTREVA